MRLIDADALKPSTIWVTDDEGIDRPVVKLSDIDAAPTVCCKACVHYQTGKCDDTCGSCFGADRFERRTP